MKSEWEEILFQEELLWKQKSRVEWIREGDKNTKNFHLSTLIRRRTNRVDFLQAEEEEWIFDKIVLKDTAVNFYTKLFLAERVAGAVGLPRGKFPGLTDEQKHELVRECSSEEV